MTGYRIARTKWIADLSGRGAAIKGGRWNPAGLPALYLSQTRALAVLENIVHNQFLDLTTEYSIAEVYIPDYDNNVLKPEHSSLPKYWNDLKSSEKSQQFGRKWLDNGKYLLMKVPSVVIDEEYNLIINPRHPQFEKVEIKKIKSFNFDPRLR